MKPFLAGSIAMGLCALLLAWPATVAAAAKYQRSEQTVTLPDVVLVNQDNEKIPLRSLAESDEVVVVDFIYATCTTICPILSAGFANLQRRHNSESVKVRLVSITIDPENDGPKQLKEYLGRYGAKPGWDFLTGSRADINAVMAAFDAYFPSKMAHQPLNFIRTADRKTWVRLDGLIGGRDLLQELETTGKQ
ncbi:MAG: SCO family protein [Thermodesulfobacteriota bacterium]